ncbi:hypothetical protein FGO68_gene3136 [Halteria grandinella]|uniref:Uncharacterized protein n=1 Tax=Halteria grandinella TaxID=5974 RepID=A0A8J8NZ51_HALGN|nr:hypothetical protein FGO68_gene3136 [Halteria grandinella]
MMLQTRLLSLQVKLLLYLESQYLRNNSRQRYHPFLIFTLKKNLQKLKMKLSLIINLMCRSSNTPKSTILVQKKFLRSEFHKQILSYQISLVPKQVNLSRQ